MARSCAGTNQAQRRREIVVPVIEKMVVVFPHLVLAVLGLVAISAEPVHAQPAARGAQLVAETAEAKSERFDRAQSTGLFVGIRSFTHDADLAEVPYAVDDAIDLAFQFALESTSRLVEPGRVKLALSGEPQKPESRQRLDALLAAGATRQPAGQTDVLRLLQEQAREVGPDGALIVAFATHGFSNEDGIHYLAASDTLLEFPETALLTSKVLDLLSRSKASRRLAFFDACRERLTRNSRSVAGDLRSAMPQRLAEAIARSRGQVIFFAARAGGYAFDDPARRNGLFTGAVIDALRCAAETDARGIVTVDTLATFVDQKIRDHLRSWNHPDADAGIEVNLGGPAKTLPLAVCGKQLTPVEQPVLARVTGSFFNVFDETGVRLWGKEVSGRIKGVEVTDLDGDGGNEVVVGVGGGGEDTGKILAFDHTGKRLWVADTTAGFNYDGGHSDRLAINALAVDDLFRTGRQQIVALSVDAAGWYQSRLTVWDEAGRLLSSYWHPGHLHKLAVGSRTADERSRIFVGGINNDLRGLLGTEQSVGVVFSVDPRHVEGEAPPYAGHSQRGSHLWYGVLLPEGQSVQRLEIVDRDRDGESELSVWTSTGHVYYLAFDGQLLGKARSDGAQGDSRFGLLVERER